MTNYNCVVLNSGPIDKNLAYSIIGLIERLNNDTQLLNEFFVICLSDSKKLGTALNTSLLKQYFVMSYYFSSLK